jgi:hypothetical protein
MKKEYQSPSLEKMEYAQFENVFTACDKNPSSDNCIYDDNIDEPGSGNSHHKQLAGEGSNV